MFPAARLGCIVYKPVGVPFRQNSEHEESGEKEEETLGKR